MITAKLRSYEDSFWDSYSIPVAGLAIYRLIYSLYVLTAVVPLALWVPLIPQAYYSPPLGIAAFFPAPPSREVLWCLNAILILFSTMLLLGWKTRLSSLGTAFSLILLNTWSYSFFKINHDILQIITPLLLAFSNWGNLISIDSLKNVPQDHGALNRPSPLPLTLLAILTGVAMLTAGGAKILTGWLDYDKLCTLGHLWAVYVGDDVQSSLGEQLLQVQSHLFWKMADWSAVALECLLIVAVVHRRLFCLFLAIFMLFHLGILLSFGISFPFNIVAYAAFFDWSRVPLIKKLPSLPLWGIFSFAIVFVILAQIAMFLSIFTNGDAMRAIVWMGAIGGLAYLIQAAWRLLSRPSQQAKMPVTS